MKPVLINVLLSSAVLVVVISVVGMVRMRDPIQRMHYIAPPASLSAFLIAFAIFVQRGLRPESFKALLIAFVLLAMNTIVTHAAARAFRIAETGQWHPVEGEEVPIKSSDEHVNQEG